MDPVPVVKSWAVVAIGCALWTGRRKFDVHRVFAFLRNRAGKKTGNEIGETVRCKTWSIPPVQTLPLDIRRVCLHRCFLYLKRESVNTIKVENKISEIKLRHYHVTRTRSIVIHYTLFRHSLEIIAPTIPCDFWKMAFYINYRHLEAYNFCCF